MKQTLARSVVAHESGGSQREERCVTHLLAMLCNIGDLHVVDRKIFTLARKITVCAIFVVLSTKPDSV